MLYFGVRYPVKDELCLFVEKRDSKESSQEHNIYHVISFPFFFLTAEPLVASDLSVHCNVVNCEFSFSLEATYYYIFSIHLIKAQFTFI